MLKEASTVEFDRVHKLIQAAIDRDIRHDLLLAVLCIVAGIGLTLWVGPEAGIIAGALSAIMFGRYFINRSKSPYFIRGSVLKKWEEKKMHREVESYYFYAELGNPISYHKPDAKTVKETVLPTNYSAEIFYKGYPKVSEGSEIILCFSGTSIYLGFITGEEFISYWD